jgi:hypothetical protein
MQWAFQSNSAPAIEEIWHLKGHIRTVSSNKRATRKHHRKYNIGNTQNKWIICPNQFQHTFQNACAQIPSSRHYSCVNSLCLTSPGQQTKSQYKAWEITISIKVTYWSSVFTANLHDCISDISIRPLCFDNRIDTLTPQRSCTLDISKRQNFLPSCHQTKA